VWWDADRWWSNERSGQFVLTEVIKLGYYVGRQVLVAGRDGFSFTVAVRQQRTGRPETGSVGMVGDNRIIVWLVRGVCFLWGGHEP